MTRFFQEDLARQLDRVQEAARLSGHALRRWSGVAADGARLAAGGARLVADGAGAYIRARGL